MPIMQIFIYNAPRKYMTGNNNNNPIIQFETQEEIEKFIYSLEPSKYNTITKTTPYFIINNPQLLNKYINYEKDREFDGKTVFVINQNIDILYSILPMIDTNFVLPQGFIQYINLLYNNNTNYILK